ncbi:MAG TPA: hypothetical protein VK171_02270 [Fimbriimonas sp.]|nr:hypothetical protein [Fimbriimonas sp.]
MVSISAALGIFLGGCQNNQPIYGTWVGGRDWKQIPSTSEEISKALASVEVQIRPAGSFTVIDGGIPFEGTWARSGDKINLRVTTVLGRALEMQGDPVKAQAVFSVRFDGKNLLFRNGTEWQEVILKKTATTGAPSS